MSGEYNFSKEQLGEYLPGMAPEQDDLDALGYHHVYRGLNQPRRADLNLNEGVGIHWSYNPDVAKHFAVSGGVSLFSDDLTRALSAGHVVSGRVHPQHVADLENRKDDAHDYAYEHIYGPDSVEEEATIREGSPVRLTGLDKVRMTEPQMEGWDPEFESKPVTTFKPRDATA